MVSKIPYGSLHYTENVSGKTFDLNIYTFESVIYSYLKASMGSSLEALWAG
jgi:hypothetical protein